MVNIKMLIIMLLFGQLGQEVDLNKRWINPNGWPKPNLSKLKLVKEEIIKDRFIKAITKNTFRRTNYDCVWKSKKVLPGYKTSQKIQIATIFFVDAYECKDVDCSPVYLMGLKMYQGRRNSKFGDVIAITHLILADIDNDGIYESMFDGGQEVVKPGTFMPGLINYIISAIVQKETQEKTDCQAKK